MAELLNYETLGAELGFLEQTDKWRLESRYFPNKVGGKPAWLDLRNLPPTETMQCPRCRNPMTFLAQRYAPYDDEGGARDQKHTCFHRTLYIFLCTTPTCNKKNSNQNYKVLRCQLARENEFYPPIDNPPEDPEWRTDICVARYTSVCEVCGCLGTKKCGACKKVSYCSKAHQLLHWKNGHRHLCNKDGNVKSDEEDSVFTLPEYEIVMDDEKPEIKEKLPMTDEDQMRAYERIVKSKNPTFQQDETVNESLEQSVTDLNEDKMFLKFREKIADYPDQVMRYGREERPLWVSASNIPDTVPPCELCGSERVFEFQIMSPMLNYLKLDSISDEQGVDWGTLVVYTCEKSCDEGPAYKEEFLWKQDFS